MCGNEGKKCFLKLLGVNMSIVGPVAIGLGIADLVLSYQQLCVNTSQCVNLSNTLVLTWVGIAIWSPIPIFLNGIAAVRFADKVNGDKGFICLFSFINTVAFAPAIVVITALEMNFKFMGTGSLSPSAGGIVTAIYAIEIAIIIIGGVLFLHTFAVLYITCCCGGCMEPEPCRRANKKREDASEYQKLLTQRLEEAKEHKLERRRTASTAHLVTDIDVHKNHFQPQPIQHPLQHAIQHPQPAAPAAGYGLGPRAAFYPALTRGPNVGYAGHGGYAAAGPLYGYGSGGAGAIRQW